MTTELALFQEFVRAVVALFVIVDPLGLVPTFTALTEGMTAEKRRWVFRTGIHTATALLIIFAVAGQQILVLFGISLHSFMIAGGILLLVLSTEILVHGSWHQRASGQDDVGIFPIGFPLLVGPGAITTIMVSLEKSIRIGGPIYGFALTISAVTFVMFLTWIILSKIDFVYRLLGQRGASAVAKVMAVFIAAIAIQFILTGLQFYYPPSKP